MHPWQISQGRAAGKQEVGSGFLKLDRELIILLKTDLGLKREKKACKRTDIYKYNLFVRGLHARTALNIRFQSIIPH